MMRGPKPVKDSITSSARRKFPTERRSAFAFTNSSSPPHASLLRDHHLQCRRQRAGSPDFSAGAVAQLGERCVRNAEVGGSSPLRSTPRLSRISASCTVRGAKKKSDPKGFTAFQGHWCRYARVSRSHGFAKVTPGHAELWSDPHSDFDKEHGSRSRKTTQTAQPHRRSELVHPAPAADSRDAIWSGLPYSCGSGFWLPPGPTSSSPNERPIPRLRGRLHPPPRETF